MYGMLPATLHKDFRGSPQFIQMNAGIVLSHEPQSSPSSLFMINYDGISKSFRTES
jgi:hypothetical protein